jgi:putative Mg2+ transporter-C (MgtC) family protein
MEAELALRVVVAVLLTLPLGWERERQNRPAGLRTHMLVAMSAALLTAAAELVTREPRFVAAGASLDPLRALQAVATGVSLLGAGTIFVSKVGGVQGLTTAASLWSASAVGCVTGLGYYLLSGVTVATALLVLVVARWLERPAHKNAPAGESAAGSEDGAAPADAAPTATAAASRPLRA